MYLRKICFLALFVFGLMYVGEGTGRRRRASSSWPQEVKRRRILPLAVGGASSTANLCQQHRILPLTKEACLLLMICTRRRHILLLTLTRRCISCCVLAPCADQAQAVAAIEQAPMPITATNHLSVRHSHQVISRSVLACRYFFIESFLTKLIISDLQYSVLMQSYFSSNLVVRILE